MHKLNRAFEELRKVIPKGSNHGEEKLSKIATLRLAIHYISVLSNILEQNSSEEKHADDCLEPTSKRQRLSDDEQETASNSSGNEFGSDCSPEGIFFNESKSLSFILSKVCSLCLTKECVSWAIKKGDKFYT